MNWYNCFTKYSPIGALILNFSGTILLLFASGTYSGGGNEFVSTGENATLLKSMYFLKPGLFKIGIGLIALGFFIQLVNEIYKQFR